MRDASTVVSQDAWRSLAALVQAKPAGTLLVASDGAIQTANATAAATSTSTPPSWTPSTDSAPTA